MRLNVCDTEFAVNMTRREIDSGKTIKIKQDSFLRHFLTWCEANGLEVETARGELHISKGPKWDGWLGLDQGGRG